MSHQITHFKGSSDCLEIQPDELVAIYVLEAIHQFGPKTFQSVYESGRSFSEIVNEPNRLPGKGKRLDKVKTSIREMAKDLYPRCIDVASKQIQEASKYHAKILTYGHAHYPRNVFTSNYPVPILYARGSTSVLKESSAVACVGSRDIRTPYSELHRHFVQVACKASYSIVSGFALGADTIGHRTALESGGKTVCVMPGGLQNPFPPENRDLWNELLSYSGGVFVSEFRFGARASALTLRKRNKLIAACARGVLVSQSSALGGAMNAFRFAVEQRKPIATFDPETESSTDPKAATSGNAHIKNYEKVKTTSFSTDHNQVERYQQWLFGLS